MKERPVFLALSFVLISGFTALAQPQAIQPTAAVPALTVDEAVICTGVVNMQPSGMMPASARTDAQGADIPDGPFPSTVGRLYCFCKISGAAPAAIKHAWYFGESLIRTIDLSVDSSPWRTWSEKGIPAGMTGLWKVEIQDANGAVLKTLAFEVK